MRNQHLMIKQHLLKNKKPLKTNSLVKMYIYSFKIIRLNAS
jgi:hypothetical protein